MKPEFWVFTYWEGVGSKRDAGRWCIDVQCDPEVQRRFNEPGVLPSDFGPFRAEAERPDRWEDCPFPYQSIYVVSTRLRQVFEQYAKSNCQFFPIPIYHHNQLLTNDYFAMKCVNEFDCAIPDLSYRVPSEYANNYVNVTIDPLRVDIKSQAFYVKDFRRSVVVRDHLKKIIQRQKFTGCGFYRPE
jgi:hypothetical protein